MNKSQAKLVLVRHGESTWNARGLWAGWTDVPLSQKGKEEAVIAAAALKDLTFDLAVTSDLIRAIETLEIIKRELNLNIPVVKDPRVKERNYGDYAGKNKWEIKKKLGEEQFLALRRGWDAAVPHGETLKDVYERVETCFDDTIMPAIRKGQNVLLVAHGNSNRALMKHLENIADDKIAFVEIATGEAIVYTLDENGKVLGKEIRSINKNKGKQ